MTAAIIPYDPLEDWPEPQPLPSTLPPVMAFDPELLPNSLRAWALDAAERMQCPLDYLGVAVMTAAAATVGRKVAIRPQEHTDWSEVPNLWACIVGRPGVMKSPAMKAGLTPIRRLDAEASKENVDAQARHAAAVKKHKIVHEAQLLKVKALAKKGQDFDESDLIDDEPTAPLKRRYMVNDATYEALGDILAQNPNGVLYFRDELVSMLKPLDREENAAARGFLLAAWNGTDSYTFDRIARGMLHIEACCVSVLGATQPGKLSTYLKDAVSGGTGDDGFAQRFQLLVWPDISPNWDDIDRYPEGEARRRTNLIFDRLNHLNPAAIGAIKDEFDPIPYLRFAPDALAEFKRWRRDLEARIRSGDLHPVMESHLSKYRGLVPKLALLHHLIDGKTGAVTLEALVAALAWAEYLETHAVRAYGSVIANDAAGARTILTKIKSGDLDPGFTARDISQRGWSGLSDRVAVAAALNLLVDLDWLAEDTLQTKGRPRTQYTPHPKVFQA